ncbi:unnamed protein product [Rangifer tarandus platyrhynchus]|uniref:Uncharacterized protein n=1 Tax=Rangifer tarandus platyrhynchus TaxID=3082113 RepID=A0AC60A877_RANTA
MWPSLVSARCASLGCGVLGLLGSQSRLEETTRARASRSHLGPLPTPNPHKGPCCQRKSIALFCKDQSGERPGPKPAQTQQFGLLVTLNTRCASAPIRATFVAGVARAPPPSSVRLGDPLALTVSNELAALGKKGSWLNLPKRLAPPSLGLTLPSCKTLSRPSQNRVSLVENPQGSPGQAVPGAHEKRIPVVTKDTCWLDIHSTASPGGSELGAAETQ